MRSNVPVTAPAAERLPTKSTMSSSTVSASIGTELHHRMGDDADLVLFERRPDRLAVFRSERQQDDRRPLRTGEFVDRSGAAGHDLRPQLRSWIHWRSTATLSAGCPLRVLRCAPAIAAAPVRSPSRSRSSARPGFPAADRWRERLSDEPASVPTRLGRACAGLAADDLEHERPHDRHEDDQRQEGDDGDLDEAEEILLAGVEQGGDEAFLLELRRIAAIRRSAGSRPRPGRRGCGRSRSPCGRGPRSGRVPPAGGAGRRPRRSRPSRRCRRRATATDSRFMRPPSRISVRVVREIS